MGFESWLNCTISNGQFSGEYAIQGEMFNSNSFSLFAPKDCVRLNNEAPKEDEHVEGSICVRVLNKEEDLVLVKLPQSTFENGQIITVKADKVENA